MEGRLEGLRCSAPFCLEICITHQPTAGRTLKDFNGQRLQLWAEGGWPCKEAAWSLIYLTYGDRHILMEAAA